MEKTIAQLTVERLQKLCPGTAPGTIDADQLAKLFGRVVYGADQPKVKGKVYTLCLVETEIWKVI